MNKNIHQDIEDFAAYLKMPVLKNGYKEAIQEANLKQTSYDHFLWELLQRECDQRQENAKQDRVRRAAFPYKKYLEDITAADLPEDAQRKFKTLSSLDFIQAGQNVIMAGNPGTGKTHLAIGLGIKACLAGYLHPLTSMTNPAAIRPAGNSHAGSIQKAVFSASNRTPAKSSNPPNSRRRFSESACGELSIGSDSSLACLPSLASSTVEAAFCSRLTTIGSSGIRIQAII
jgi:hypothetical protein